MEKGNINVRNIIGINYFMLNKIKNNNNADEDKIISTETCCEVKRNKKHYGYRMDQA